MYKNIDLDIYAAANHMRINAWNEHNGIIDQCLAALSIQRKICVELPSIMIAPHMLQNSDLMITLPFQAVSFLKEIYPIDVFELPFAVPEYELKIFFLKNKKRCKAQQWLLEQMHDMMQDVKA